MLNELETKPVLPAVLHTEKTELMVLIECALPTFLLITVTLKLYVSRLSLLIFKFTVYKIYLIKKA